MIRRLEVENFMSLRNVRVDLKPLTVFFGNNATGKSAIFKALVTLSKLKSISPVRGDSGEFTLDDGVTFDHLVWDGDSSLPIKFRLWLSDNVTDVPDYLLELAKRAEGWGVSYENFNIAGTQILVSDDNPFQFQTEKGLRILKPLLRSTLRYSINPYLADSLALPAIEPIRNCADALGSTWRYRPSANDIARFVRPPSDVRRRPFVVSDNGWGLAYELQKLQGENRSLFTDIEGDLCSLFPHIRQIGFNTEPQGVRITYMTNRSQDPVPAAQEADGVLLATFLLWRLHTGGPNLRICLEEPESGLHPTLVGGRLQLLQRFAQQDDGVQILVASHSRELARAVLDEGGPLYAGMRQVHYQEGSGTTVFEPASWHEASQIANSLE